jgi:ribosomal protein S18 acetylase RimI-like enzyme
VDKIPVSGNLVDRIFFKSMIQIRRATINDSAGLARIQVDSYRSAYAGIFSQAYLEHFSYEEQAQDWYDWMMNKPRDLIFVAQTETGEMVGYALGRPGLTKLPPFDSELVAMHVRQTFQRQGIGRGLMAKMAEQLQERGCASLMLWVLEQNPARSFYEKMGGQMVGKQEAELEEGVSAVEVAYGWRNIGELVAP